jgi:hypothetical protein
LTRDQHDAFWIAAWLQRSDHDGRLPAALEPDLSPTDRQAAEIEGWILGVAAPGATNVEHRPPSPGGRGGQGVRTKRPGRATPRFDDARGRVAGTVARMPEISRFLGIVIYMYYADHGVPHFHAVYGDREISVEVQTGRVHGSFPPRALRHVREWARLNHVALLANWDLARRDKPLAPIPPLE